MGQAGARSGARGGEDIQALREASTRLATGEASTRLATGAASLVGLGALAVLPIARGNESRHLYVWLAGIAIAALGTAVALGWSRLVPVSLVVVGGSYAAQLAADDAALDTNAALVAAGLYVTAELAYWSLEERSPVHGDPGEGWRHLAVVALLGLAAFVVAVGLVALADVVRTRGLAVDLVGAGAAAAALLAVVLATQENLRAEDR